MKLHPGTRRSAALGGAVLTALSAALYSASFPPLALGVVAWVALAPFLVACTRVTPAVAAALGLLWGMGGAFGAGGSLTGMLSGYFGWGIAASLLGHIAVAVFLAGAYYAPFAFWLAWLSRRRRIGLWTVAAGWGACELVRARAFVGNPWALTAYSQVEASTLMQLADIAGPYGIGMLVAAVNAAVAAAFAPALRGRFPRLSLAVLGLALASSAVYGRWRLSQEFATGSAIRVAIVQGAVERGLSWQPEYRRLGLGRYLGLTRTALATSPDLVVWPENSVGFYLGERSPESVVLLGRSGGFGAELILGGPHYVAGGDGVRYYNSVFLVRDGWIRGRYDKRHLLPVAEEPVLGVLGDGRMEYAPGEGPALLETRAGPVGAFVCFEAMYPEIVRPLARAGAELLVNLSNDSWFDSRAAARHHLDIASVRAIESRRYLVRAASTGYSAVVDAHGRIRRRSEMGVAEVLDAEVRMSTAETPYQWWGDAPAWCAAAFCLLVTVATAWRSGARR